jgi:hypothetical protein
MASPPAWTRQLSVTVSQKAIAAVLPQLPTSLERFLPEPEPEPEPELGLERGAEKKPPPLPAEGDGGLPKKKKNRDGGLPPKKSKEGGLPPRKARRAQKLKKQAGCVDGVSSTSSTVIPYEQLLDRAWWANLDGKPRLSDRWKWMADAEFVSLFCMSKAEFEVAAEWKQRKLLKKTKLH